MTSPKLTTGYGLCVMHPEVPGPETLQRESKGMGVVVLFCSTRARTQGLVHARPVLSY